MADGAGFRREAARTGARVRAMALSMDRRKLAMAGAALALLALTWWAIHWATFARFQVSTDNAYVRADTTLISAQVQGYVRAVPAAENQAVHAGDPLVLIEASDYEAQVAAARAAIAQAEGARAAQQAQRQLASADVARYRPLAERGLLSPARMQQ